MNTLRTLLASVALVNAAAVANYLMPDLARAATFPPDRGSLDSGRSPAPAPAAPAASTPTAAPVRPVALQPPHTS